MHLILFDIARNMPVGQLKLSMALGMSTSGHKRAVSVDLVDTNVF